MLSVTRKFEFAGVHYLRKSRIKSENKNKNVKIAFFIYLGR